MIKEDDNRPKTTEFYIKNKGDLKSKLTTIYNCSIDQIVDFPEQIIEDTKVYFGNLDNRNVELINNRKNPLVVYGCTNFGMCGSLTSIPPNMIFNGSASFMMCDSLTSIPKNTTFNGYADFEACHSLTSIPKTTIFNGKVNFGGCNSLTSIPEIIINGDAHFEDCDSLTSISEKTIFNGNVYVTATLSEKLIKQLKRVKEEGKIKGNLLIDLL